MRRQKLQAFPKHQRHVSSMSIDAGYIADNRRFSVAAMPNAEFLAVRFDLGPRGQVRVREHLDSLEDQLDPGRELARAPREPGTCMKPCGIS